jgi:hypothetical protein
VLSYSTTSSSTMFTKSSNPRRVPTTSCGKVGGQSCVGCLKTIFVSWNSAGNLNSNYNSARRVATITARYIGLILPSKMIWARDTKEMLSIWADRKRPTNDGDGFRRKRQNVGTQVPNGVCKNVHGIQMTLLMILLACETDGFRYM